MSSIGLETSLGSGKFGTVYRVNYHGTPAALKIFGSTTTKRAGMSAEARAAFIEECKRIKACKHENIVQYMATKSIMIDQQRYPALLMTLMDISLQTYVTFQQEDLLPHKEIKIALDIAKALNYLHEVAKFVHGDLHCGNVLLKCVTANEGPVVKLCDFGLTKVIDDVSQHHSELVSMTSASSYRGFLEPESGVTESFSDAYLSESYNISSNSEHPTAKETEIRRFGAVMWRIHIRQNPEVGSTQDENLQKIKQRPLYVMVKRCWDKETPPASASELITLLDEKKTEYPVVDPCSRYQETIAHQQRTIASQQETIAVQATTINRLQSELEQRT